MAATKTAFASPSEQPYLYKVAHNELGRIIGAANRAKTALDADNVTLARDWSRVIRDAYKALPDILK